MAFEEIVPPTYPFFELGRISGQEREFSCSPSRSAIADGRSHADRQKLDGELGSVNFDPNDPESIEAAIASVEAMIGAYPSNPFVGPISDKMKEKYREAILENASSMNRLPILPDRRIQWQITGP